MKRNITTRITLVLTSFIFLFASSIAGPATTASAQSSAKCAILTSFASSSTASLQRSLKKTQSTFELELSFLKKKWELQDQALESLREIGVSSFEDAVDKYENRPGIFIKNTEQRTAALAEYKQTILTAMDIRKGNIDAARTIYREDMLALVNLHQETLLTLVNELIATITTATSTAKINCSQSGAVTKLLGTITKANVTLLSKSTKQELSTLAKATALVAKRTASFAKEDSDFLKTSLSAANKLAKAFIKKTTTGGNNEDNNQSPTTGYMPGTPLKIPASATVLTLSGLNFNLYNSQPKKFQGIFSKDPYKMVKVDYPASISRESIAKGVAALDTALRSHPGQKIVLAQSQGAQVVSRWLREHQNDPPSPIDKEITFLLTGNPLRATGGNAIGKKEVDGITGQPTLTNTRWPIIDFARRYDGWADWVKDESNSWAVKNAEQGKLTYHMSYDNINIKDPSHTIWTKDNTTFVLTKEKTLPLWGKDSDQYPGSVISTMRSYIESAYDRPSNDPKPSVEPTNSWYWNIVMRLWNIVDS